MANRFTLPPPAGGTPAILPQGVAAPKSWQEPAIGYLGGLAASTLSGATELVGITLPGAAEFRRENPVAGFVSQMAGVVVPYGGWFAGAKKIGSLVRLADKVSAIEKSPFLSGAVREATMLAPFEVGRVAASQVLPWSTESFPDAASAATFDLALGAGVGGALHSFAAAGRRAARVAIPGLELDAPAPLQLRKMKEILAKHVAEGNVLTIEQQGAITNRIKKMDYEARTEQAKNGKYVTTINANEAVTRQVNDLFKIKTDDSTLKRRMFAAGTKAGFSTEQDWRQSATWNFLPDNFAETGRFFREITFKPTEKARKVSEDIVRAIEEKSGKSFTPEEFQAAVDKTVDSTRAVQRATDIDRELRAGLKGVGFGWLMGKEENGLYVLAKKTRGKFGEGKLTDRWVLFKTDQPGTFLPKHKAYSDEILAKNAWVIGSKPLSEIGSHTPYGAGRDYLEMFDTDTHDMVDTPGKIAALLPQKLTKSSSEVVKGAGDAAREYLAPTSMQMRKSPLGRRIWSAAKLMHDVADTRAHEITFGKLAVRDDNAFKQAISPSKIDPNVDSISSILAPLDDGQVDELVKLSNDLVDPAQYDELVANGTLSPPARAAADRLEVLADVMDLDHQQLAQFLGTNPGERAKGNLGLVRKWEGDARIALRDESGQIVAVVAGKTKRAAQQTAARITSEQPHLHVAEQIDISKTKSMSPESLNAIPVEIRSTIGGGGTPGLRGFKGDYESVPRDELLVDFQQAYHGKLKWQAERGEEDLVTQLKSILNETDPTTSRILDDRLKDLRGEKSKFDQWQNDIADLALAPMVGPRSASKIVQATNTAMSHWHLGMGNLAFPIMNLFSIITNWAPEAAMVIGASERDLGGTYTYFLAGGTKGPIAASAVLSPGKIMFKSMREMANPSEDMQWAYARAGADATTQPRVAEEFTGQNATRVQDLKSAFSGVKDFAKWTRALSEWLMTNSERMSRIHALTASWITGRDVLGITDREALYRWSKEMTDKSMFNYTTADRPRIFNTPAGSMMGLFKTWMANYMAAMFEYSGQALKGNWAPLAWQTAGTAAVGGVAATPLYWIADGFSKAFLGGSLLQETYDNLSEGPADALMFGMPAALTGISLYSQSTNPLSNPARDASMLWSSVLFNRAAALSRTAGLAFDNWSATGQHPGSSRAVRDALFQALAPSTVSRAISAFSGEDMIRSLSSGYPLMSSVTIGDRLLYALKLNPIELDKAMAVADELYRDRAKERAMVVRLGRAFAEAQDNGDSRGINEIMMQAMAWGIDPSKVLQSAMRREQLQAEPLLERTFSPEKLAPVQAVLGQ